jgi:hypothetical protein
VKRHGQLDGALRDLERDLAVERDVAAVVEVEQVERHVVGAGVDRGLGDERGAARLGNDHSASGTRDLGGAEHLSVRRGVTPSTAVCLCCRPRLPSLAFLAEKE